jgi:hypothetical protein
MKDSAGRIQDGLKIYKMFHVLLSDKRRARHPESVGFVQPINEGNKPALRVRLSVWHFAKLRVSASITRRKITEEVRKNFT